MPLGIRCVFHELFETISQLVRGAPSDGVEGRGSSEPFRDELGRNGAVHDDRLSRGLAEARRGLTERTMTLLVMTASWRLLSNVKAHDNCAHPDWPRR